MATGPGTDDIGHRAGAAVELTMVTMVLDASDAAGLAALLSQYVVTTRGRPGCRNVDLCASLATPDRFVVIEKWESPDSQAAHFDSPATESFARALGGLLRAAPQIDLLESVSAHDLA